MAGRRTIGVNPLSLPTAVASTCGPNPLDVLIPRTEPLAAPAETVVEEVAESFSVEPALGLAPTSLDAGLVSSSTALVPPERQARGEADDVPRPAQSSESEAMRTEGPAPGQYLVFEVGGESLAISILHVREILEYGLVTRVPRMPDSIRGVTNLRGSIVPIVDLAVRLGLPPQPQNPHTCVVVVDACLGGQPSVVGIVADTVSTVRELDRDDVSMTPALGSKVTVDAFSGLGRAGDRLFPLLDATRVFSSLELGPGAAHR